MSSAKYREAYKYMTDKQKEAMWDLYNKCVNYDGHSWATYTDVENCVAEIIMAQKEAIDFFCRKDERVW